MRESDYKRNLVKEVNALPGGYARRFEDKFGVGRLDLIIKLPALPIFFAEAKMFTGNVFTPTELQYLEGQRILAAGVDVFLLGWKNGALYIAPWARWADIRDPTCRTSGLKQVLALHEFMIFHQTRAQSHEHR